ncbi:diguanylate cyclase domain-containing protein [Uliginosibacterium sediminicola]|uniref:Diguanylate cyclase n=1 Tax=Uliginosibacterium sediminicola TaxID=2024550 RepID=A0ABU9YX98_9RHOO
MKRLRSIAWLIVCLLCMTATPARALEQVRLQLKWTHAFQFAGYYAAQAQGYYREAGLQVDILPAPPDLDPVTAVVTGKAEYGVGTSSLLLARHAGKPVVALAVIFQHSPLVLLKRYEAGDQSPQSLAGKRIMIEPQAEELLAYLRREQVPLESIHFMPHSHRPRDLIDGRADAMSAYEIAEPFELDQLGIHYQRFTPRSAGIEFYGDNLFTSEQELKHHAARAEAFRSASLRGWQYAMAHPREIAELIEREYSPPHPINYLLYEAQQMDELLHPDLVEIGYMNPKRWRHIADTYAELGLLPKDFPLDRFLYQAPGKPDLRWLYGGLAILVALVALMLYVLRMNHLLKQALTSSQAAKQTLRESEERHRMLADNASDVIWVRNLQGELTYISPSVEKIRGYTPAEAMRQTIDEHFTPASARQLKESIQRGIEAVRQGKPFPTFRGEVEARCKDGSTVWADINTSAIRNHAGDVIGILGVARDISMRREAEARMRHMAQHDQLTGLPNRNLFSDRLGQAIADAQRHTEQLALMYLDLDKFKPINDNFGHATGDLVLREAAARMCACVRDSDTVARVGGDEFIVLLRRLDNAEDALRVADKIRQSLRESIVLGAQRFNISCSIGIAIYPQHGDNEITLCAHADQAMYNAKHSGRDKVTLYGPAIPPVSFD